MAQAGRSAGTTTQKTEELASKRAWDYFQRQLAKIYSNEQRSSENITAEDWRLIHDEFNRQADEEGSGLIGEKDQGKIEKWVGQFIAGSYWNSISGPEGLGLLTREQEAVGAFGGPEEEFVYDEMHKAIAKALGLEPDEITKPFMSSEGVWGVFGPDKVPFFVRQTPDGSWTPTYRGYQAEVTGDEPNYIRIGVSPDGYVILAPDNDPTKTIVTEILDEDYQQRLRDSKLKREQLNFLIWQDAANRRADAIQTNFQNELSLAQSQINAWTARANQAYNEATFNSNEMYRAATHARANREFEVSTRLEALAQQEQSRATNIQAGFQLAQIRQNSIDQVRDILRSPSDIVASGFALAGGQVPGASVTQADLVNAVRNDYNAYEDYLRTFGTGFNAAQFMASIPPADAYKPQAFGFTESQPDLLPKEAPKALVEGFTPAPGTTTPPGPAPPKQSPPASGAVRDKAIFGPGGPDIGANPPPVVPPGSVPGTVPPGSAPVTIDPGMTPDEQAIHEGQAARLGMQPNVGGFQLEPMPYITRPGEPPPHRPEPMPYITRPGEPPLYKPEPMPYITRPYVPPQWLKEQSFEKSAELQPVPLPTGELPYVPPPPRYEGIENLPRPILTPEQRSAQWAESQRRWRESERNMPTSGFFVDDPRSHDIDPGFYYDDIGSTRPGPLPREFGDVVPLGVVPHGYSREDVYFRGGGVTGFGNPVVVGDSGNGRENQELVMSLGGAPVVVLPMTDRQEDIMASASGRVPRAQFGGGYGFNDFSMDDVVGFGRNITGLGGGTLSQAGGLSGLLDRGDRVTQSEILGMAKQRTPPRVQAFLRGDPEPLKQRYFDRPGLFPSGMPTPGMYASLSPSEKEMLRTRLLMETPNVLLEDVEADIAARYGPTYARRGKRVF